MFKIYNLSIYSGGTPMEERSYINVGMQCENTIFENHLVWQTTVGLIANNFQISQNQQDWVNIFNSKKIIKIDEDPLNLTWRILHHALGFSDYPLKVSYQVKDDGFMYMTLISFCPYLDFVKKALKLFLNLLNTSIEIVSRKLTEVNYKWPLLLNKAFDQLILLLPPVQIRLLHRKLWDKYIAWEWLGNEKTRIGVGVNQTVFTGVPELDLFNDPTSWSVPIYTITGSVGKTTTTRLLWQLLQNTGKTLALAVSDGAWIGLKKVSDGDCIGGRSAQALLKSPVVEGAVFEQGRGGLIKQGVPYSKSDVAILLNVQSVHLGIDGIHSLEQMADTKVTGLRPARIWVLNYDDTQCRRISAQHAAKDTVWFSVSSNLGEVQILSRESLGVLSVARDADDEPVALCIFQSGHEIQRLDLTGVAPYHGLLGEKTLEELLAAVAAAWFGPLIVNDWPNRLSALRLDSSNHTFRTSIHRQGQVIFVLDKAAELASLTNLKQVMQELAEREGCQRGIVVLTRSAGETPERHQESAEVLHSFMDEFVCFDRPDTYTTPHALPIYSPGSIPQLLKNYFEQLNEAAGVNKPVVLAEDWAGAQKYLLEKLSNVQVKTLVLINQPGTGLTELNQQILEFSNTGLDLPKYENQHN